MSSISGLSSAWLALHWPSILQAERHAHSMAQATGTPKFEFFSAEQALEVEAIASQIIPSDDGPGAREARTVYFIDRALTTFEREKQSLYPQGLNQLEFKTREMFPGTQKFSSLNSAQQIQLLGAVEKTDFFETVRVHTIMGFLANPEYGGNYNNIGWKTIGFEDQFFYEPPFGYYDAEYKKNQPQPAPASDPKS
jgi:gluconate 2-dehydrogenase gamma chain